MTVPFFVSMRVMYRLNLKWLAKKSEFDLTTFEPATEILNSYNCFLWEFVNVSRVNRGITAMPWCLHASWTKSTELMGEAWTDQGRTILILDTLATPSPPLPPHTPHPETEMRFQLYSCEQQMKCASCNGNRTRIFHHIRIRMCNLSVDMVLPEHSNIHIFVKFPRKWHSHFNFSFGILSII